MELEDARTLAHKLMDEHGLIEKGWRFDFDNAKKRNGQCSYHIKRITVSKYLVMYATAERVEQTILHEIAHALLGPGFGHGPVWKAKAISLGHSGERTSHSPYAEMQAKAEMEALEAAVKKNGSTGEVGVGSVMVYKGVEYVVFKKAVKNWHARNVEHRRRLNVPFGLAHLYVKP